jgi:hypothetical protein
VDDDSRLVAVNGCAVFSVWKLACFLPAAESQSWQW